MTSFEIAVRDAVVDFVDEIVACEQDLLDMVKESLVEGDGIYMAEEFLHSYVNFNSLQDRLVDDINRSLEELEIDIVLTWKR